MSLQNTNQFNLFFIFFLVGLLIGAIFGILKIINLFFKHKKIFINTLEGITLLLITFIYLYLSNVFCFGVLRLYLLIAIILGVILERIIIGKMFAKFYIYMYNRFVKISQVLKNSKIGRIITK